MLGLLAYPGNLALAGVAAFLLALPGVTWLSAWVACGRALWAWLVEDDQRAFTGTFRQFAATWRRTLPASVLATLLALVLLSNLLFLRTQQTPVALLFAAATVPVAAALALLVLMLPAAAAREPDAAMRRWLYTAAGLAVARPLWSLVLLVIVAGFAATATVLPTIVPFFGISLPVWLGLETARRASFTKQDGVD